MTQLELAQASGISKQAISKNKKLPSSIDSNGQIYYDPLSPIIQAYIARQSGARRRAQMPRPAPVAAPEPVNPEVAAEIVAQRAADRIAGVFRENRKAPKKPPQQTQFVFPPGASAAAEQLNNIDARKNKAMAENYELKNEILRGDYIERALLHRFLGKLFAIDQSEWKTMPDRASPELTAAARSADTDDLAQVAISEILKREAHATLRHVQEIIKKFLFDIESLESIDELAIRESEPELVAAGSMNGEENERD